MHKQRCFPMFLLGKYPGNDGVWAQPVQRKTKALNFEERRGELL